MKLCKAIRFNFEEVEKDLNELARSNEVIKKKLVIIMVIEEAEEFAKKALQLDSSQVWVKTNLAHGLLFQNKYDDALKVYKELKYLKDNDNKSYAAICLEDLDELETKGITNKGVIKIREYLKEQLVKSIFIFL